MAYTRPFRASSRHPWTQLDPSYLTPALGACAWGGRANNWTFLLWAPFCVVCLGCMLL